MSIPSHGILRRINEKGITGIFKCSLCDEEGEIEYFQTTVCSREKDRPHQDKLLIDAIEETK